MSWLWTFTQRAGAGWQWLKERLRSVTGWSGAAIVALVLAAATWAYLDWRDDPVTDIGLAWSASIERLGIRPLFPPVEDFHVGDIYAVLRDDRDEADRKNPLASPFSYRSFRVARVDLRQTILAAQRSRPVLVKAAGEPSADNSTIGDYSLGEADQKAIALSKLLFPGIDIVAGHSAGLGTLLQKLTGGSSRNQKETIRISDPMTYGIDTQTALAELSKFCGVPKPDNVECNEDYLRFVIASQYGRMLCAKKAGKFDYGVNMVLVSRVFMSREIEVARSEDLEALLTQASATQQPLSPEAGVPDTARVPARQPVAIPAGRGLALARGSTIDWKKPLSRPVTFGFHAVTLAAVKAPERSYPCQ